MWGRFSSSKLFISGHDPNFQSNVTSSSKCLRTSTTYPYLVTGFSTVSLSSSLLTSSTHLYAWTAILTPPRRTKTATGVTTAGDYTIPWVGPGDTEAKEKRVHSSDLDYGPKTVSSQHPCFRPHHRPYSQSGLLEWVPLLLGHTWILPLAIPPTPPPTESRSSPLR